MIFSDTLLRAEGRRLARTVPAYGADRCSVPIWIFLEKSRSPNFESSPLKVLAEFDYRNAKAILQNQRGEVLSEIYRLLNDEDSHLRLGRGSRKQQDLSKQIQQYFVPHGWETEKKTFTIPDLKYDLVKEDVPIEIEIGHRRLVYADFLKFLVDYSQNQIPAGIMVVAENPRNFGHEWHSSRENARRKIQAISGVLLVPILVLGIQP